MSETSPRSDISPLDILHPANHGRLVRAYETAKSKLLEFGYVMADGPNQDPAEALKVDTVPTLMYRCAEQAVLESGRLDVSFTPAEQMPGAVGMWVTTFRREKTESMLYVSQVDVKKYRPQLAEVVLDRARIVIRHLVAATSVP